MWSLGVIFYTLLGGYHPFHDERQPRLFRRIRDGSYMFHDELWDSTSDQAKVCASVAWPRTRCCIHVVSGSGSQSLFWFFGCCRRDSTRDSIGG